MDMQISLDFFSNAFSSAQEWLFEAVVQPLMYGMGWGNLLAEGFSATGWLLVGVLQIVILLTVIRPLERYKPVEAVKDRAAIRTDILYTLIHRLGLFRLVLFFTLMPFFDEWFGMLRAAGWSGIQLDGFWPGVSDHAVVSLLLYLVVLDFFDYWLHRGQHRFEWWWSLHALHHSQRQMTMWSDNRNHLIDDVLRDCLLVVLAQCIGIAPSQFVAIVAFTQLSESFQHANVRLWFGAIGERLWVSPRFHRMHHAIGLGHESLGKGTLGGVNFGVLLPWWDMLFGTANFDVRFEPTGVRDQVEQGREYGRSFLAQQWLGLKRLVGRA
jgi:sterol desaturase/sphingolipid hydroxylase (fatty acid hydroxylase superfamily)